MINICLIHSGFTNFDDKAKGGKVAALTHDAKDTEYFFVFSQDLLKHGIVPLMWIVTANFLFIFIYEFESRDEPPRIRVTRCNAFLDSSSLVRKSYRVL